LKLAWANPFLSGFVSESRIQAISLVSFSSFPKDLNKLANTVILYPAFKLSETKV
jgi:hypothetical protein